MSTTATRGRWPAFGVCLGAAALAVLDTSKVNVAVPSISDALAAGPSDVQLIVAGYSLALGLVLVPAGRLGDLRSRRALFLIGLVLFGVASLACAFAPTALLLGGARVLEGIAAGILLPQALGLIQQLFDGAAERGTAFGLYGAVTGLTTAIAPPIGGLMVGLGGDVWGWRFVFLLNVPLVLVTLLLALVYLPKAQAEAEGRRDLDLVGVLLLALATFAIMAPFVFTTGTDADDPRRWLLLPFAALLLVAFVRWERAYAARGRAPVVEFALLRIRSFRNGVVVTFTYYAGAPAAVFVTTLYLQFGLGAGALVAGLAMVPFGVAYMLTAWLSGRLTYRFGRRLVILGLSGVAAGWSLAALTVSLAPVSNQVLLLLLCQLVAGAGSGAVSSPNQTLMLNSIPKEHAGLAGSITQVAQRLGSAVGLAVLAAVFYGALATEVLSVGADRAYPDAYRGAIIVVLLFTAISLLAAIADERWRNRLGVTLRP